MSINDSNIRNAVSEWVNDEEEAIIKYGLINTWDTSSVTDMSFLFDGYSSFNDSISNWDVSNVTTMRSMFSNASSFNQDINSWVTSNVENMDYMFDGASSFNLAIDKWDVSKVTTMRSMLSNAPLFNQELDSWVTSNVENMDYMFDGATAFNSSIAGWDVSKVTSMRSMLSNAPSFNQELDTWNTSNVQNMDYMFDGSSSFNKSIESWDLSSLTTASNMFLNASSINQSFFNFKNKGVKFFGSNGNILSFSGLSGVNIENMFLGASSQTIDGNFCFLAGTPVLTDQGLVEIEKINGNNTINKKPVRKILSFTNNDSYMVMFKKNSLGLNSPSEDTIMSQNHGVYIRDHIIKAKALINENTILRVHLSQPPQVYNVLVEGTKKQKMIVNNMEVETMCPKNYNKINGVRYLRQLGRTH